MDDATFQAGLDQLREQWGALNPDPEQPGVLRAAKDPTTGILVGQRAELLSEIINRTLAGTLPWQSQPNAAEAFCIAMEACLTEEGNAVTVLGENPEGTGPDNRAVEVTAEWTDWEPRRFTGHTPLEAMLAAGAEQAAHR